MGRLGELPDERLQLAQGLSDLAVLERLHGFDIPGSRVGRKSGEQVRDDLPGRGRAVKQQLFGMLLDRFRDGRFGGKQRVERRRLLRPHDGHGPDAERARLRIEGGEEVFGAAEKIRIVDQEGFRAFVESDDGDGMPGLVGFPADDEGDPAADEPGGDVRRGGKEANVVSPSAQPIGGGPFGRSAGG